MLPGRGAQVREILTTKELVANSVSRFGEQVAFQMRQDSLPGRQAGERYSGYRKLTFKQAGEIILRLQAGLLSLGVALGDRVALISENRPEWAMAFLAITSMGAIVIPLDAMLRKEEVFPLLEDSDPKAVILSQKFSEYTQETNLKNYTILMENLYSESPMGGGTKGEIEKIKAIVSGSLPPVTMDDIASLVYTSGTTEAPKGVMLTHQNLMSNVTATASLFDIGPGDNFLSVLPLHHTFETTAGFLGPFYKGCTITYAESLKSYFLLRNMQETGATVMCGVPLLYQLFFEGIMREAKEEGVANMLWLLFALSKFFKQAFGGNPGKRLFSVVHKKFGGKIRFFVTGGATIDPDLIKNFELMGFPLLQGYGLTESAPVITCCTLENNRIGSAGKPIPGVSVKIAEGGKVGEILASGPNIMKGYYKRKDLTDEVIDKTGWLHTGDVGCLDDEGFLFITGRLKDVIVTASGVNVYPEEIELALRKLPSVAEGGVLGSTISAGLRKGTEEVAAVIVPREGFSETDVKKEVYDLNKTLAAHKRIARIIVRKEELPKTRLLKVKKFELRKELGL
ncbi:AMP-binding protein [Candidatus Saganbacteria bacterium]|uniref:AMP-binding protein n=1 Tax=Candidatus Saganbacteria bacterium TaxID=2575572 RepID=A0A9D6UK47_UNCSA|nr:AMP-binding protein [Candidatus Saganbacteria bacterium]